MSLNPFKYSWRVLGLLLSALLLASTVWGETLTERYQQLNTGSDKTLPGTTIDLISSEQGGVLSAEVNSILSRPYDSVAPALVKAENWCQFLPLHFNIKACTYEEQEGVAVLTVYSGRKTYQSPEDSHAMSYRFDTVQQNESRLSLMLYAARGPANTRDYRIALEALRVEEGTLLHIRSSYRPSAISTLLTHSYLATLGNGKVGFSRVEEGGESRLVEGIRGIIERNVMRYHLAVDTFLATRSLPAESRHEAALSHWFHQNDSYPQQLHEMTEAEYLAIKRREWTNQQKLQQTHTPHLHKVTAD